MYSAKAALTPGVDQEAANAAVEQLNVMLKYVTEMEFGEE
jgi:hypothetical protein